MKMTLEEFTEVQAHEGRIPDHCLEEWRRFEKAEQKYRKARWKYLDLLYELVEN